MKRFRAKRRLRLKFKLRLKPVLMLIGILLAYQLITTVVTNVRLMSSNEDFLLMLLQDGNHHLKYEKQTKNVFNQAFKLLTSFDLKEPTTILSTLAYYETDTYELDTIRLLDDRTYYVTDPKKDEKISDPRVYIYNSHQLENYDSASYQDFNIKPGVMMASYILREKLKELGIGAIVEEGNITDFLNINGWDYSYSYEASRYFIKNAMEKHDSIELFIDIHRDAIIKSAGTIAIDGKNYAKLLFVVGLEHQNYQKNLDLADKFNLSFEKTHRGLSRGVITKQGAFVNGIYNQDLSPNMMLLEVGGYENTIDEVLNSLEVVAQKIKEHLNG